MVFISPSVSHPDKQRSVSLPARRHVEPEAVHGRSSGASVPARTAGTQATSTLLGIFRVALDSSLIERGTQQAMALLGSASHFWSALKLSELERMAQAGNAEAQAELAWRLGRIEALDERVAAHQDERPRQAAHWAGLAAAQGCAAGQAVLGWLHYHGRGLAQDHDEAARLFTLAASQQEPRARVWQAVCLLYGHGLVANPSAARSLLLQAAAQSGAAANLAHYWLGQLYYFGEAELGGSDYGAAVHWLSQASDAGHVAAKELLARCHFFGRGCQENRTLALQLWREAAEAGSATAQYCVGMYLYAAGGQPQERRTAIAWLRAAARAGISGAMYLLAHSYSQGQGITRDDQLALAWYRRAAAAGNRDAAYELAQCHAFGRAGLTVDMAAALPWYQRAAELGQPQAQRKLAHHYRSGDGLPQDSVQAMHWYRQAAEAGDVPAMLWLAECFERGEGCTTSAYDAANWYQRAAASQDPHAMAELGRCCLYGIGLEEDVEAGMRLLRQAAEAGWSPALAELEGYYYQRALHLQAEAGLEAGEQVLECIADDYRRAAELGHQRAAYRLALCHQHGLGVVQDDLQAMNWLRKAAGLMEAKLAMGDMYYYGHGPAPQQRDLCAALGWYQQAVEQQEDAYAMYSLGHCLLHGEGCPASEASRQRGLHWLEKAAQLGEVHAQYELGHAHVLGATAAADPQRGQYWLGLAAAQGHAAARELLQGRVGRISTE